jgi:hypothetical protein
MDPAAAIVELLLSDDADKETEIAASLKEWFDKGGFRPTLAEVRAELDRRGVVWQASDRVLRLLGATG